MDKIDAFALQVLDLSWNVISDITNTTALCALTTLNLNHNQLKNVPKKFAQLTALKTLNLAYNAFSVLPDEVLSLASLATLDLTGNLIGSVSLSATNTPTTLQTLFLADNRLSSFPEHSSPCLKHVSLDLNSELSSQKTPLTIWQRIPASRGIVLCGTSISAIGSCPDPANVDRAYLGYSYQCALPYEEICPNILHIN